MTEQNLFVARDGEQDGKNDYELFLYDKEPIPYEDYFEMEPDAQFIALDPKLFPEIKNGEVKRFRLIEVEDE